MDDFGVDIDLSEFFAAAGVEKKKKQEELDSLISNSFEEFFLQPLKEEITTKPKKKKIKKISTELVKEVKPKTLVEQSLGLLAEPSDTKVQNDQITPLNQNFVTLDQLNKHYNTFLNRIQQQLSTLGGGGESNLTYMDVPLKYVSSSSYTITPQDYYIGVNYAGRVNITLPTPRKNGKIYIVKDERGEASKGNNRHIYIYPSGSDLIDGQDYTVLAYDFGSLTFVYRDGWRVI